MGDLPGLWIFEALRRGGADVPALQADVPEAVQEVLMSQEDAHPDRVNQVLTAAARTSGDANIGLRMKDLMTLEMLGTFGFVLLNAPTVGRLLHLTDRYYPVLYRGMEFDVVTVHGGVRVRYRSPLKQSFSPGHLDAWTMGFFVDRIRQVAGADWHPVRVALRSERPSRFDELHEHFGPGLEFGASDAGQGSWFECQREVLDLAFEGSDHGVLDIVTGVAEKSLEEALSSVSFATRARVQLRDLLRTRQAGSSELARRMAVSLSTLKRRLAAERTNYRTLYDECLREYATELLLRTDLRVGRIAWELGYADASSFDHAFRRVFGVTPSEYRDGTMIAAQGLAKPG